MDAVVQRLSSRQVSKEPQGCCILGNSAYYLDETQHDHEHRPPSPLLTLGRGWPQSRSIPPR